jgi:two-component system response regulator HupR/HoxA
LGVFLSENNLPKVLAVDDEQSSLNAIKRTLRKDFNVILSLNGPSALEALKKEKIAVILADQRMPEMTGVEFFQKAIQIQSNAVRILITGYTDIEAIIQAINEGKVYHYITKPWEPSDLRLIITRAVERHQLLEENQRLMNELRLANEKLQQENIILHKEAEKKYEFENIIADSPAMQEVFQLMRKVIPTNTSVLLLGETGTGKELIARAIHYNSTRKDKMFVAQNCAALPDTLLESELFGHVKGAFTGAIKDKKGLFELADGGTIFLDEIADTSHSFQQKLLRVLQEREIWPIGSEKSIKIDVRVISATNRNLQELMRAGTFRDDLYYRLNTFPINVPPLRDRREDIPLLTNYFLKKYQEKMGKKVKGIDNDALRILLSYSFPGNVRELENEIQRAVTLVDDNAMITYDIISNIFTNSESFINPLLTKSRTLKEITENIEKYLIKEKLKENKGNITHTASSLGISRVGLQKKIIRYQISTKNRKQF